MFTRVSDVLAAHALALVTDQNLFHEPSFRRRVAWHVLLLNRHERLAARAVFHHRSSPGDAA